MERDLFIIITEKGIHAIVMHCVFLCGKRGHKAYECRHRQTSDNLRN